MSKRNSMQTPLTIGLDLGDRRSRICVLDAAGEVVAAFSAATTAPGLQRAFRRFRSARVVMEVGTHSPWISRLLEGLGYEVIVANARSVRLIAESDNKSDPLDAELLARVGRVDPKLLRPIRHRGEEAQRDLALLHVRDQLVQSRAAAIAQARGLAKALGMRLPKTSTAAFARTLRRAGLVEAYPGLESLVTTAQQLTEQIASLGGQIEALCAERYPETKILRQIRGVGPITALAYVLTLEDPRRFAQSRQVGAYLGLRPKRRQSGQKDPALGITKSGDVFLRRLLVQCAHYIMGPLGPDSDLQRFGRRLAARGGRAANKKAVVAVGRKLAVLLHRLWVMGEVYEPLHAARRAEAI